MDREILFRGKTLAESVGTPSGCWVYGSLEVPTATMNDEPWAVIISYGKSGDSRRTYYVDPATVGQFTGLTDEKGGKVFEGDIIRAYYFGKGLSASLGVYETDEELTGVIDWGEFGLRVIQISDKHGKWAEYTGYKNGEGDCLLAYLYDVYDDSDGAEYTIEVIGNIHDNPELTKRERK